MNSADSYRVKRSRMMGILLFVGLFTWLNTPQPVMCDNHCGSGTDPVLLDPVTVINDVIYDNTQTPTEMHMLDIYSPISLQRRHPVLVYVHGGGFMSGDKSLFEELGYTFSSYYGYTTVVVNYELSNESDGNAVHPDHIMDVAKAFSWVVDNIASNEYGYGDPSKIFIMGQSAGGYLVSLLATDESYLDNVGCTRDQIRGVVSMSGLYDLWTFVSPKNPLGLEDSFLFMYRGMFWNAMGTLKPYFLIEASPIEHVGEWTPPFLVMHAGNLDMPGIPEESEMFAGELDQADPGSPSSLVAIPFSAYDRDIWHIAVCLAEDSGFSASEAGHWASIMSVNTHDPQNMVTTTIVDFINSILSSNVLERKLENDF